MEGKAQKHAKKRWEFYFFSYGARVRIIFLGVLKFSKILADEKISAIF